VVYNTQDHRVPGFCLSYEIVNNWNKLNILELDMSLSSVEGVGAYHGNLPHVGNFTTEATLTQISIQATAR
jgi:hypothetical protein